MQSKETISFGTKDNYGSIISYVRYLTGSSTSSSISRIRKKRNDLEKSLKMVDEIRKCVDHEEEKVDAISGYGFYFPFFCNYFELKIELCDSR